MLSRVSVEIKTNTECKSFLLIFSQVRATCSQLAIFEAEVSRLTEIQASAQEEWGRKTGNLQSELSQATAQKVEKSSQQKMLATAFSLSL